MSAALIENAVLKRNEATVLPELTEVAAGEGALVPFDTDDAKTLILIENAGGETATAVIHKGDGIQGVADMEVEIEAGATVCIVVESMKFKNMSGENKGNVLITGSANLKVGCVVLP